MHLSTRSWGSGERYAVLLHGMTSDSGAWHRVAPRLAEAGYACVAVDLPGHGLSPRGGYTLAECVEALLDTVPAGPALAVGHSFGGLVLSAAVPRLRPGAAVYVDPPWRLGPGTDPATLERFRLAPAQTGEQLALENPRWSPSDLHYVLAGRSRWDPASLALLDEARRTGPHLPAAAPVPSLVVRADGSDCVGDEDAEHLRRAGFTVRTVAAAGHSVFRDDLEGFLAALDGFVDAPVS